LQISRFLQHSWYIMAGVGFATWTGLKMFAKTPKGAYILDGIILKLPVIGNLQRKSAVAKFARTLGTLERSGVSLMPALKIVENTIGNRVLAAQVAQVAEETRGGDSLAAPLRKLGLFPGTVVKMIDVGEQSGRLDEMLLKVADIEERQMRRKTKTLISLLAPILIMAVGAIVGFMVISILLPIFKMSRAIH